MKSSLSHLPSSSLSLSILQSGVTHRDLKLENILLDENNQPKVNREILTLGLVATNVVNLTHGGVYTSLRASSLDTFTCLARWVKNSLFTGLLSYTLGWISENFSYLQIFIGLSYLGDLTLCGPWTAECVVERAS